MLLEAIRMFGRNIRVKLKGYPKYIGNDEEICKRIIEDCYDHERKYLRTTSKTGNYPLFYARDFGMCSEALVRLGYKGKVIRTLEYAMDIYSAHDDITVAIDPIGKTFNFPNIYSPDSVAYLFRALRASQDARLVSRYSRFLNKEILNFEDKVIDKSLGIVNDRHFSGMRDHVIVRRSCYDMIMACMLESEIEKINRMMKKPLLVNPLKKYDLRKNLVKHYWNGYFKNSPNDSSITSHCNLFPFWLGIIEDRKMRKLALEAIEKEGLLKPLPAKYSNSKQDFIWQEIFVPNWESRAVWSWLGMVYIDLMFDINRKKTRLQLKRYSELIEKHGFVELYDENLLPFQSFFFCADNSMIWASMYLDRKKRLEK